MRANALVICGDLTSFTEFSLSDTAAVEDFCLSFHQLVDRHLSQSASARKFMGDSFTFVYDLPDARGARLRHLLESAMVLQYAYRTAISETAVGGDLGLISDRDSLPRVLGLGLTMGNVFFFDDSDGHRDFASAYVNLAAQLAEEAKRATASHILLHESVPVSPDIRAWLDDTVYPVGKSGFREQAALGLRDDCLHQVYSANREVKQFREARAQFYSEVVKTNAIPQVLKVVIRRDASLADITFAPNAFKGMLDRTRKISLVVYALGEDEGGRGVIEKPLDIGVRADRPASFVLDIEARWGRRPTVIAVALQSMEGLHLPEVRAIGNLGSDAVTAWFQEVGAVVRKVRTDRRGMAVMFSAY